METLRTDVAVIGAGTAGMNAYRAATGAGARAVLIEAGDWGTTCVRAGCMPSKLLLAAGHAAREVRHAAVFGVSAPEIRIDGPAVMARVREMRARFLDDIFRELASIPETHKISGRARFVGPTTLRVDERLEVTARAVVVATGARSEIPPALAAAGDRLLTNESVFELDTLPASLAVIGAGPLGLELGLAFARLGVRTALFDTGEQVGGARDPEVAACARTVFGRELDLHLGVEVRVAGDRLQWSGEADRGSARFERILVAAGRPPSLAGLDLASTGLPLDAHGMPPLDPGTLRCGDSAIFMAGDVTHLAPVLHEAARQGELAGGNAARLPPLTRAAAPPALAITFADPDLATLGARGRGHAIGTARFESGRALIDDRAAGVIRLSARRTDHVVTGAEMIGPGVEHLAHLVAAMVAAHVTVAQALTWPFYHPTVAEVLQNALRDLARELA
ncbi:MAG: dihydrolipoyl dehydrogenase [Rhodospirillales bacterium]|nr:dihydrolipoyl dehydrogenase [Rhodospirillales bacterium]